MGRLLNAVTCPQENMMIWRRGYRVVGVEDTVPSGGPLFCLCGMMWMTIVCPTHEVEPKITHMTSRDMTSFLIGIR